MITITEAAEKKIANLVAESEKPIKGLRIGARLDPAKQVDYKLAFISDQQVDGDDQVVRFEGFDVYMDPESADLLAEAKVDYVDGLMGSGFKIERPRKMPAHLSGPVAEAVHRVIETQINPGVASHGGVGDLSRCQGQHSLRANGRRLSRLWSSRCDAQTGHHSHDQGSRARGGRCG